MRMGLIVGKRRALQKLRKTLFSRGRVDRFENGRERTSSGVTRQFENLLPVEKPLHRLAKSRPKFHLASNRPFQILPHEAGIENKFVRKLDWLAHEQKVA